MNGTFDGAMLPYLHLSSRTNEEEEEVLMVITFPVRLRSIWASFEESGTNATAPASEHSHLLEFPFDVSISPRSHNHAQMVLILSPKSHLSAYKPMLNPQAGKGSKGPSAAKLYSETYSPILKGGNLMWTKVYHDTAVKERPADHETMP